MTRRWPGSPCRWHSRASTDDIRSLLYDLENSDDFFVIENVSLTEGNDEENELSVALLVSTYYRTAQVPAPPANGR